TVMLPENRVGKRRQEKNRNGVNAAAPFDDVARLVPRLPIIGSEFLLVHDDALDWSSRRNRSRSSLDGHLERVRLPELDVFLGALLELVEDGNRQVAPCRVGSRAAAGRQHTRENVGDFV